MPAATTDKFKKAGASTVTTLAAPGKALAASSITVGSTTNYPTDTGIVIAIRVVDSEGELVAGTYTEWRATVTSGTTLAIETTPVYGSDQVYAAGSTTQVFIPLSSYAQNELVDGMLEEHDQDGTHKDITADSITTGPISVTENIDVVDGKSIRDGNDNELITFSQTASAVNEITVKNAATGNAPQIQATGGDTNVDLNLVPKGTGAVRMTKWANPYKFSACRSSAWSTPSNTTSTIVFDTEVVDTNNNYNNSTGEYTAPVAGFYSFTAAAAWANSPSSVMQIYVNGNQTAYGVLLSTGANLTTCELLLAANDVVTARLFTATSQTGNTGIQYTRFSGFLVSMA